MHVKRNATARKQTILEKQVRKMWINVLDADRSTALWMDLDQVFNGVAGTKIYNKYCALFNTIRRNSFVNTVISLARFCDKNKTTASFDQVLKDIKKSCLCSSIAHDIESKYNSKTDSWEKIRKLRNNCYAHSSKDKNEKELLAEAGLTEAEIIELIDCTKRIIKDIGEKCLDIHFEMDDDRKRVKSEYLALVSDLE